MADYDFEAWAQARVAPSKPNPNQQAASSMRSAGIGGLGGRATTSSAQRIQDSFRDMRENSRTSGSTYDAVPQTITSGLGSPLSFKETEKKDDRNLDQKIYDGMKAFGARLFPPRRESTSDYVLDVYETSPMFRIPTVPEVTEMGIEKSFEQKLQEMFSSQDQNVYTPEIEGTGSYDEVPAPSTNQNLMRNRINSILKDVIAPNSKEYEIQKGDTLSDISLREGVSIDDLAQVNEIENPNMILEGATLIIPEAQEMEKAKEYVLRVTTRGDENLVDVTDPDRQFYQSGVPMDQRDFAPEAASYLDNQPQEREGLMSTDPITGFEGMGPDPSTGQGIMTPPSDTANVNNPQTRDGISFISTPAIDNIYEEIGAAETTTSHLGASDFEDVGITLGYGIVPTSGLKYEHNGTVIELPDNEAERWNTLSNAGVTRRNFRSANVITDDVVKDGVRRDRYDSDESFTKAVMKDFQDRVETAAERQGVDADDIPEDAMTGLVGYSYNTGNSHNYNLMRPVYEELTQGDNANMNTVQTGMLQVFTSGGIVIKGLGRRRAEDYNHVAESLGKPTITHLKPVRLANQNAGFEYTLSDGTTLTIDSLRDYETQSSSRNFKSSLNRREAL